MGLTYLLCTVGGVCIRTNCVGIFEMWFHRKDFELENCCTDNSTTRSLHSVTHSITHPHTKQPIARHVTAALAHLPCTRWIGLCGTLRSIDHRPSPKTQSILRSQYSVHPQRTPPESPRSSLQANQQANVNHRSSTEEEAWSSTNSRFRQIQPVPTRPPPASPPLSHSLARPLPISERTAPFVRF